MKYSSNTSILKEQHIFQQLTDKNTLIDALIALYNNTAKCQNNHQKENTKKFLQLYKPVYHEMQKTKLSVQDFQFIHKDHVAKGAFAKVAVVKHKNSIYAMKIISKANVENLIDRFSPMDERLVLSNQNEEWLPQLYASFQDKKNLYLVMEYAPGGDLEGLMERRSNDNCWFLEQEAKFYAAELVLAVERVHQLGYMHRDIKPGNILIDKHGHIKLGDLGSCISIDAKEALFMVGTNSYVSPEMCSSFYTDSAYGPEVDWWSVATILYELLFGKAPFTDYQIQMGLSNSKTQIEFPTDTNISKEAEDLLSKMLNMHVNQRLGINGASEIKSHPFFKDIDWDTMHSEAIPPFIPDIKSPDDITFFSAANDENDYDDNDFESDETDSLFENNDDLDNEFPFIGYTYTSPIISSKLDSVENSSEEIYTLKQTYTAEVSMLQDKLKQKDQQLLAMQQKFDKQSKASLSQQETTILNKRVLDLERENLNHITKQTSHVQQIKEYQGRIASIEKQQFQSQSSEEAQLLSQTQQLKSEITTLNESLRKERSECDELKQKVNTLQEQNKQLQEDMKKNSSKTLPTVPASKALKDNSTVGEGNKSVVQLAMWQHDRKSLLQTQAALRQSESELASTKSEAARLRKESKYYQLQLEQKKDTAATTQPLFIKRDNSVKATKNEKNSKQQQKPSTIRNYYGQQHSTFHPTTEILNMDEYKQPMPLIIEEKQKNDMSQQVFAFQHLMLSNKPVASLSSPTKRSHYNLTASDDQVNRDDCKAASLTEEIKREKEFIQSTKKTITARARLSQNTELNQVLNRSLERAEKKLLKLENELTSVLSTATSDKKTLPPPPPPKTNRKKTNILSQQRFDTVQTN